MAEFPNDFSLDYGLVRLLPFFCVDINSPLTMLSSLSAERKVRERKE